MSGFALLILIGTILLTLPISSAAGEWTPLLDSLFTATSATCVTGLIVHDTATYWSTFGHVVILSLIQIGGLGIVTVVVALGIFSGKKLSLKQKWIMQESLSAPHIGGILNIVGFIVKTVFAIEVMGAISLSFRFIPEFGFIKGTWYSVFHSISAFCNAGFDLMGVKGEYSSLTTYTTDYYVLCILSILIIVGGIGFFTWDDIKTHKLNIRKYSLQAKVSLSTSAILLVGGCLFYLLCEMPQSYWNSLAFGGKILNAWFQSVTMRTAGFNSIALDKMSEPSQMVSIFLMLIGGSPSSTAGGLKTTTLAVLFLGIRAVFVKKNTISCFGRSVSDDTLRNAGALLSLYLLLSVSAGVIISYIENLPILTTMFETVSAIGTVGLSLGITPSLSSASRVIIIFLMFFGRMGGLTVMYAFAKNGMNTENKYPKENLIVG